MFIDRRHVLFSLNHGLKRIEENGRLQGLAEGRRSQAIRLPLAPEGRHVYRQATCPNIIKAPEGRHVYRRATCSLANLHYTDKAPEGRHVADISVTAIRFCL